MNITKNILKYSLLLSLAIILLSINALSTTAPWVKTGVPGVFVGTDQNGGIICAAVPGICFYIYYPTPPGGPGPGVDPGKIVALWVPISNYGLVDFNGMTIDNLSYGDVYTPITDENTQEVSTEQQVIEWLNANYGE